MANLLTFAISFAILICVLAAVATRGISMNITYRIGNLLKHPGQFIAHGCNAQGVMGSGVALAIRTQYPKAFTTYRAHYESRGLLLGNVIPADCGRHTVFNCITQEFYGRDGGMYVSYDAIERAVQSIDSLVADKQLPEVGYPLIGGDLGGGDWSVISNIIQEMSDNHVPVVYLLNRKVIDDKGIDLELVDEDYVEGA